MNRLVAIARLQTLGRREALIVPPAILGVSFAVNLAIFGSVGEAISDQPITGGLGSLYITALVFGVIAVTQHFPFALGMSVTRREFAAATGLFVLAQTLIYSVLLVILQAIEDATDGWGMRLRFFGVGLLEHYGVATQLAVYAVPLLIMTLIGTAFGTAYTRWKATGIFTTTAVLTVVLGGGSALMYKFDAWPALGHWITHTDAAALFAAWPLPLVALLAAASWLGLRRATV